ncbi:hypothetical protein P691DRAFT_801362 [Macrolepiota fuliginosa MF-IS2]|uniref:Uncharacterized protein n=1 Tax=Macrolepiota fuliginosa MF-IS2 TaxID=1400762 RepID=A0A9P6C151_9AGAR|nr:hypothetical protein P691DRAFT_801362 [Macrolepiota fuliginosa MF-IS2]
MARNPNDQERALNAAAAREIALELNTSSGTPPTLADSPAPTSPRVGRQSVSPRPEYATSIVTPTDTLPRYTEELHSPPPVTQQYSGASAASGSISAPSPVQHVQIPSYASDSSPPRFSPGAATYATPPQLHIQQEAPLPSPYEQEFDPYEEHAQQEKDQGYSAGQAHVSLPAPQANPSSVPQKQGNVPGTYSYYEQGGSRSDARPGVSPSLSSPRAPSPPLEQPNAPYLRSGLGSRGSSSSLNAAGAAGGGKISAAAFKRPSPRHGSASSPFGPPSPTPFGGSSPGFGSGPSPSTEGGRRLPSPYSADQPQGYAPQGQGQGQQVQPLQIKKRVSDNPDADQYDYIGAYVESGGDEHEQGRGYDDDYHAGQVQRAVSANAGGGGWAGIGAGGGGGGGASGVGRGGGGYGQGRFATDLENESML